ncbi:restriction endonuclease subunit S [Sporofaciens musculi]|jgi:type I restriction enzyme S subunit|uniref:restriction endonuclease subunit S n=1 Tax=Sporofaciens musculi TaxID=2681861 RepID=UPI00259D1044|nr:restriction endonuclease subunit S [Sporofaciens musculi]
MAREMKDSGISWIGQIPADWSIVKIKAGVHKVGSGKTPSGGATTYADEGILFLRSQNVYDTGLELSNPTYITPAVDEEMKGTRVFPNDVLLNITGGSIGRCCIFPESLKTANVNQHVSIIRVNQDIFLAEYMHYYWVSPLGSLAIDLYQTGGNREGMSADAIKNTPIILIPLDEQRRICRVLDDECSKIDSVLAEIRTSIEEYKKLKQAIITQAVTKGIRGDRPMKESGIEWVPMIPEDWSNYRGKHLFYETNERSETGSEELLTVSHKTGITPRRQKNVNMFMSESLVGYKICREGDIAANTMWMWQGAIGVSAYHGVISPSYNTYRQRNNAFDLQYLDYLLRIPPLVDQYNVCSTGITASRLRLYPEQFLSFNFPVPSMEEQREIVMFLRSRVDEMDALIQKKEQFLAELETYKKSLIYEYVTGKKEVV